MSIRARPAFNHSQAAQTVNVFVRQKYAVTVNHVLFDIPLHGPGGCIQAKEVPISRGKINVAVVVSRRASTNLIGGLTKIIREIQ